MHSGGAGADIRSRLDKKAMLINLLLQPFFSTAHGVASGDQQDLIDGLRSG